MTRLLGWLLLVLVQLYRYTLSPLLHLLAPGCGCRFEPSCSAYALQAIRSHGPWQGSWLAAKRLCRCHPWGGCGFDPVPRTCACPPPHHQQHAPSYLSAKPDGRTVVDPN